MSLTLLSVSLDKIFNRQTKSLYESMRLLFCLCIL